MLPIAILPAAGLLLGIGGALSNPTTVATYPILNNQVLQGIFQLPGDSFSGKEIFNCHGFPIAGMDGRNSSGCQKIGDQHEDYRDVDEENKGMWQLISYPLHPIENPFEKPSPLWFKTFFRNH